MVEMVHDNITQRYELRKSTYEVIWRSNDDLKIKHVNWNIYVYTYAYVYNNI